MPGKVYRTAIYCRLSREDGDKVESNSIASQRAICEDYIARHDDLEIVCEPFVDDGYSGVSFNRPNFKKLEDAIRKGAIDCIVVKDLSRFSRNYIDGGRYLEKIFPQLGIRFIAVNDAYDSLTGDPQSDSFVIPFKNLINDSYCKDISMKIRSSLEVKQKNGEFVGAFAPYGYKKSPDNKNQLIVDGAVSEYVQMIFAMYKDGFSIGRIAARLNQMGVLSPIFENTHEELVDQETWDIVQEVRSHKRRRTNMDEQNMFSGLVYCADCGKPMVLHRAHTMKPEQNHFTCRTYKKDGAEVCSAHYIREVALKEIVLETIRRATEFARSDPERFAAYIQQKQSTEVAKEIRGVERELSTMRKRDGELDVVFKRMYEDSALGRVSNEQFRLLSEAYSKEKAQLAEAIPATEERLEKLRSSMANAKNFIAKARKFTDMTELTPELLRTFVAKIIVYEKEVKYSKHAPQKIHICFRDFNLNETDDMLLCGETTEKADSTIALPA